MGAGARCSSPTQTRAVKLKPRISPHDMSEALHHFDTSNFEPDHPLYSTRNHRVLGKMKSETGSIPPLEFVGLRAKIYSLSCGAKSQKKTKGIQQRYVKKTPSASMSSLRSKKTPPKPPLQNSVHLSQPTTC